MSSTGKLQRTNGGGLAKGGCRHRKRGATGTEGPVQAIRKAKKKKNNQKKNPRRYTCLLRNQKQLCTTGFKTAAQIWAKGEGPWTAAALTVLKASISLGRGRYLYLLGFGLFGRARSAGGGRDSCTPAGVGPSGSWPGMKGWERWWRMRTPLQDGLSVPVCHWAAAGQQPGRGEATDRLWLILDPRSAVLAI